MLKGKNVIAIIPARSGSKSIKNKNIIKIKGKRLIEYSIEYAKRSKLIDEIVVSTDSQKYLQLIKKYKLNFTIQRNKFLSGDSIKDFPVIKDALKKSENFFKKKFEYIILLRPTSPFRERGLIEKSLRLLSSFKKASSVRAMKKTKSHPFRHWKLKKDKRYVEPAISGFKEPYNLPRQQLPLFYFQTGDIETIRRSTLIKGSVSGKYVLPILLKKDFVDIDDRNDLKKITR